ncbi:MAG TPA: flavoprotein, partial [Methanocella sp.]|nr:flavoprotein [Methanocella sp.]
MIGITGASGVRYGIRLLEVLNGNAETHLIVSEQGRALVEQETDVPVDEVLREATFSYADDDFMAPVASGSFRF